jgi:hypothetical protein
MNSEIIYNKINNLENKVDLLYKNKNLNSSILQEFDDIEKYIKDENKKDENNPIYNTLFKNLDLFRERTLLKIEEINLKNQLNETNTTSITTNDRKISSRRSYSDKISILSYKPKKYKQYKKQMKYKEISNISDIKSSEKSSIVTSEKSSSSSQYLIYILVIIVASLVLYFIVKGMF